MSSHQNSTKNPFGPPPSIFDNSGSSNPQPLAINHLFSPLQSPSSSLYSPTTNRSAPNTSSSSTILSSSIDASASLNEWGAPPQSQTELFKPSSSMPPPPPPQITHFSPRMLQHHNSFNIRPPPPPPPQMHHQSSLILPQLDHNYSHNYKKRKRSPASKSDRNVKRRIEDNSKFDYPRNYHKDKYDRSHRSRSRSGDRYTSRKRSRSRSRSPRAKTRSPSSERRKYRSRYRKDEDGKHQRSNVRTHSSSSESEEEEQKVKNKQMETQQSKTSHKYRNEAIVPRDKHKHKDTKRRVRSESIVTDICRQKQHTRDLRAKSVQRQTSKSNSDDHHKSNAVLCMKERKKKKRAKGMFCAPPPKPPTPPMPTREVLMKAASDSVLIERAIKKNKEKQIFGDAIDSDKFERERRKKLDVVADATEYLQNIGFTVHGFARHVFALAPLMNFGEDLVFPMNTRMKRDGFENAFHLTEERKALCASVEASDKTMKEVSDNVQAYINAALKDNDENSMRIMLEVNMKQSSKNRENVEDGLETKLGEIMREIQLKQNGLKFCMQTKEKTANITDIKNSNNKEIWKAFKYNINEKVQCMTTGNNVHEAVILARKMDFIQLLPSSTCTPCKVALYLVHFMSITKDDEWVTDGKILRMDVKHGIKSQDIKFKYGEEENILCWHEDHLYTAKISKRVVIQNSAQYMVHYHGWNKAWDEWVQEDRILPKTLQNMQLMNSMDIDMIQSKLNCKSKSVAPVNNIHNINMNTMKRMPINEVVDASSDETDATLTVPLQIEAKSNKQQTPKVIINKANNNNNALMSGIASIPTMNINVSNINTNTTTNNIDTSAINSMLSKITQNQALRENFVLKQEVIHLRDEMHKKEVEWNTKYKKKAKKCRELKECAKRLYSECVHGEGPRWHLIEFRDTEHRVTRDAELADLRTQICSLYAAEKECGTFDVLGIQKWKGQKAVEQSVKQYVTLNGEYSVEALTYIKLGESVNETTEIKVDLRDVLEKFSITSHRIQALNGQHGVRLKMDVPQNTCFGQYFGGEISQAAFGKVFDGTGEEHDHNIYAFDQKIDKLELAKLKLNQNIVEDIPNKVFIIDPFIGDWKNDELLLRYVNDCRADIDDLQPSEEDLKYYNVEFVGMKVNGWPQTYLVAKRDIKQGEELMTFYGTDFSNAIAMKLQEEHKKKLRKHRIDRDILQGVKL